MAEERRRVAAETEIHARAVADNLVNQGYAIARMESSEWELRKTRRRGDLVVTITITRPTAAPPTGPPPAWGPPTGPPAV